MDTNKAEQEFIDAWEEEINSDAFKHGQSVGYSIGLHKAADEALRANSKGEIDLWLDMMRPKSLEEWEAWHKEHGTSEEIRARWSED